MAKALGIYLQDNLIKYSKLSETKGKFKIEAYGVKYVKNLKEDIKQIIEETDSKKIPIVVNSEEEEYDYLKIFAGLNKSDFDKIIDMQFEEIATDNMLNKKLLKTGYIISEDMADVEKLHVLHVAQFITAIETRVNLFGSKKPTDVIPTGVIMHNLVKTGGDYGIVNMEEKTEFIGVMKGNPYHVEKFNTNLASVIKDINKTENSIASSYETLKNTILPVNDLENISIEENPNIPVVLDYINGVIDEVKGYLDKTELRIKKIYLTGTGATISNIEAIFNLAIPNVDFEVLKPNFIYEKSKTTAVKELIDVNTATALALQELGMAVKTMNFATTAGGASNKRTIDFTKDISDIDFDEIKENLKADFTAEISVFESFAIRMLLTALIVIMVFSIFSMWLEKGNMQKQEEADKISLKSSMTIQKVKADIEKIDASRREYEEILAKAESARNKTSNNGSIPKDSLPNFLNRLAHAIPVRVTVLDIKEERTRVTVEVESKQYEQLGFFIGILENEGILYELKTDFSQKRDGYVNVRIEGRLP